MCTVITISRNYIFTQKYNSDDDDHKDKYALIQDAIDHAPVSQALSSQARQQESGSYSFGGLQHHFNNYFGGGGNGEEQREQSEQPDQGVHIQLARR